MEKIKIKINSAFGSYKVGDVVEVLAKHGEPKEIFWRNRIADSAIDGCVEVVLPEAKKSNSKGKE